VLWFQKPGTKFHRRRGGTRDRVVGTVHDTSYDQAARPWEQSLASFQQLVRSHTNPPDVICDPMMGWGTTLEACLSQCRPRVIGIELLAERYAYACQRLGLRVADAPSAAQSA
jgi:DNA modification methylase